VVKFSVVKTHPYRVKLKKSSGTVQRLDHQSVNEKFGIL